MIHDGLKTCSKCGRWMPLALFCDSKKAADGLQARCKYCESEYNQARGQKQRAYSLKKISTYKEFYRDRATTEHGVTLVEGGEFHHRNRDDKKYNLSMFFKGSYAPCRVDEFDAEMRKCTYYKTAREHAAEHTRMYIRELDKLYASEMAKLGLF